MPQLSIKKSDDETVVTVCDSELFGKKLQEGKFKLEVKESFYEGDEASFDECLEALEDATIGNLVGSIVEKAIEAGYVNSDNVLEIEGVPHAQFVRI